MTSLLKRTQQGQRCAVKKTEELTKNHRVNDAQAGEGGMMVANDNPNCPVHSFEKYLTHLNPLNEFLFFKDRSVAVLVIYKWCRFKIIICVDMT